MHRTEDRAVAVIKTPRGIRFDCSGCGNCCLQWPVPLTGADVAEIERRSYLQGTSPIKRLPHGLVNMQSFTHSLEKKADGRCIFLNDENRCKLHLEHGEESKPAMCRLFPYTFSSTPEGICASVSFASTGVLFNAGRLLSEQIDVLRQSYELFQKLFPTIKMDWQTAQLVDGLPLKPDVLTKLHYEFTEIITPPISPEQLDVVPTSMPAKLSAMSQCASKLLSARAQAERMPPVEARPEIIDQLVLKYLGRLYFPANVFAENSFDLDINGLMKELISAPHTVHLDLPYAPISFSDLAATKLGTLEPAMEDLINRFLYCRVFSWMYFGPGFNHLSLLAGIHHLLHLNVLLRLKLKCICLRERRAIEFVDLAELVRMLERRLTQLQLSAGTKAGLEVLLPSLNRADRIGILAE